MPSYRFGLLLVSVIGFLVLLFSTRIRLPAPSDGQPIAVGDTSGDKPPQTATNVPSPTSTLPPREHESISSDEWAPKGKVKIRNAVVLDIATLKGLPTPRQLRHFNATVVVFGMHHNHEIDADATDLNSTRIQGLMRFVGSLRRHGARCCRHHVPLLVLWCRHEVHNFLRSLITSKYPNAMVIGYPHRPLMYQATSFWSSSFRYTFALNFLHMYKDKLVPEYIMVSDTYDVVFQSSILDWMVALQRRFSNRSILVTAEEVATMTAGDQQVDKGQNLGWVRQCGGGGDVSALVGKPVMCSGTTLGSRYAMELYLDKMDRQIRNGQCGGLALDQGAHNIVVNRMMTDHKDSVEFLPQSAARGFILTLNGVHQLLVNATTRAVLNTEHHPYVVLHQVNRCEGMVTRFEVVGRKLTSADAAVPVNCSIFDAPVVGEGYQLSLGS